jgi:serralysin
LNSGTIKTLTNSGTITGGNGGVGHTGGSGGSGIDNTGTIATLTNTGTISNGAPGADAILSAGANASIGTLFNSGHIEGAVALLGGSGDTLDNLGRISGNVALGDGDILMNQGQVAGDVTLGASDTLTDTGAIQGDVTLGASDTFDMSSGDVSGAITASSGDLLEFSGNFGHETIDNFTATGAAHDTLELGSAGFGAYAALSSAMAQVGPNVVIGLGADSITLVGVAKSSLVSADFKFA